MLPPWLHELATYLTLAAAAAWLLVSLVRTSKPRAGCARCEANRPSERPTAIRSKRLQVLS